MKTSSKKSANENQGQDQSRNHPLVSSTQVTDSFEQTDMTIYQSTKIKEPSETQGVFRGCFAKQENMVLYQKKT